MKKFKIINENKVMINPPIESPLTWTDIFNNAEQYILELPTITYESDGTGYGCITEGLNESGVYIKLDDILTLFGAKKSKIKC